MQQAVAVLEHDAVELLALVRVQLSRLQSLQIESNGRDRRLQLVRYRVQKRVVLFVATDLADEKDGIQDHPGDDQSKENDAQNRQHAGAPVEDNPADGQGHGA